MGAGASTKGSPFYEEPEKPAPASLEEAREEIEALKRLVGRSPLLRSVGPLLGEREGCICREAPGLPCEAAGRFSVRSRPSELRLFSHTLRCVSPCLLLLSVVATKANTRAHGELQAKALEVLCAIKESGDLDVMAAGREGE